MSFLSQVIAREALARRKTESRDRVQRRILFRRVRVLAGPGHERRRQGRPSLRSSRPGKLRPGAERLRSVLTFRSTWGCVRYVLLLDVRREVVSKRLLDDRACCLSWELSIRSWSRFCSHQDEMKSHSMNATYGTLETLHSLLIIIQNRKNCYGSDQFRCPWLILINTRSFVMFQLC